MKESHKHWLMHEIELMVKNPEDANFGIKKGRVDLEIIISVNEKDKQIFSKKTLKILTEKIAKLTGVLSPVVYLDGKEPAWLAREILC